MEWARRLAREKGLASYLSPDILEGLVETGQVSLGSMERQIAVLSLYVRDLDANRIEDPLPFGMPDVALQQSYRLTDPLLRGESEEALEVLNRFLGQGIAPLALLARIAWEIRKLWALKDEMTRGPVSDSFMRSIRIQPFKKAMYTSAARRLSWGALGEMVFSLGETDRLLKSSRLDPRMHLEALCQRMARLAGDGSGAGKGLREQGGW
jgi:DNA polymerase-3 subunit delta